MKTIFVVFFLLICTVANAGLPGMEGRIQMDVTAICSTKNTHDELRNAQVAGDTEGVAQLLMFGKCSIVRKGDEYRILENSWTISKVRMLTGESKKKAGWIYNEAIR